MEARRLGGEGDKDFAMGSQKKTSLLIGSNYILQIVFYIETNGFYVVSYLK